MKEVFPRFGLIGVLLVYLALSFFTITQDHDWGGDFSEYISQAISIAKGKFEPLSDGELLSPFQNYPWGTGFLLAPFYMAFGFNLIALKLVNVVCYLLLLLVVWWGSRNTLSRGCRLALVLILAVHPVFLKYMNMVLSDIPALLFATAAAMLLPCFMLDEKCLISKHVDSLILGILIAIAYIMRPACLILLVTLSVSQVFWAVGSVSVALKKGGHIRAVFKFSPRQSLKGVIDTTLHHVLPYIGFTLFLHAWHLVFPKGSAAFLPSVERASPPGVVSKVGYIWDSAPFFYQRVLAQAAYYLDVAPSFFLGSKTLLFISSLFFIGGVICNRRREYSLQIYMAGTLLMYLLYPGRQAERYLFTIAPFYFYYLITGGHALISWVRERARSYLRFTTLAWRIAVIFMAMALASDALDNARQRRGWFPCFGPHGGPSQEMFEFVRRTTKPDDIVLFFKPRVMKLYAERWSQLPNRFGELPSGRDYFYVHCTVHELKEQKKIKNFLADLNRFVQVYQNDWFTVYRIEETPLGHWGRPIQPDKKLSAVLSIGRQPSMRKSGCCKGSI